jgi:DNA-binding transcriptional LysR family regulator
MKKTGPEIAHALQIAARRGLQQTHRMHNIVALNAMPKEAKAMDDVDLNLLVALDALLAEGSVTGAARRLGLSPSAMSRTLARLRSATGDPLLVRAGRGLVPTPYAAELRARVPALSRDVLTVLSPRVGDLDIASLDRTFTIRANEGFVDVLSASLVAAIIEAAPRVRLRFAPKPEKDARPLREGQIDLEIGVMGAFAPEVRGRGTDRQSAFFGRGYYARTIRSLPACRGVTERGIQGTGRRRARPIRTPTDRVRRRAGISRCDADRASLGSGRARAALVPRQCERSRNRT